jgi:hypothetical protein
MFFLPVRPLLILMADGSFCCVSGEDFNSSVRGVTIADITPKNQSSNFLILLKYFFSDPF